MLQKLLRRIGRRGLRDKTFGASAVEFSDIAAWQSDDHGTALKAFLRQREKPTGYTYKKARFGCDPTLFEQLVVEAEKVSDVPDAARQFFENNFVPVQIDAPEKKGVERSVVTAFFEPQLRASLNRTDEFHVPVHARPAQLVDAKLAPTGTVPDGYRFAWRSEDGRFVEAPDRAAIHGGAVDGIADVIAWLADPVDAFFMHIQGAARLQMEDGTVMRVTYAAKSGHPFTSIWRNLARDGHLDAAEVSMQSIAAWLRANPDRAQAVMNENRSYIFFQQSPVGDVDLGPVAAAKIQLTPYRSLAVDMGYHTFGTPIFINAAAINGERFDKLMIAQETGTAIRGPARGDIFFGTGQTAGEHAGAVVSPVQFTVLCPRVGLDAYLAAWSGA